MSKVALITGITGQDGAYMTEFLLKKGYVVHGIKRRASSFNTERIDHLYQDPHVEDRNLVLHYGDLTDSMNLTRIIQETQPDEIYNLAAQSFVPESWTQPLITGEVTGLGVTRLLEAVRSVNPKIKFYQASTSEMFGKAREVPQNETTPFYPRSPYGVAKVYGYWITVNYREKYDIFALSGVCFNHESPRRGLEFVTRKISHGVAKIALGQADVLPLGNLEGRRDWGYTGDYVEAMWLMLQQGEPEDFVIGTGTTHSVRELCEIAFDHVGLNYRDFVVRDERFFRPVETNLLVADPSKAKTKLGWEPKVDFEELIRMMVDADLERLRSQ